ncbi:metallophosphoesterase family protein [Bryocella elongata]|uniref:metallophosphoesterase family protein n=1 Tax=Bryocella elongata TaxID=863522 RepID=UPI001F3D0AA5|nr:metallophosphoesterase [Bryocella elongata]
MGNLDRRRFVSLTLGAVAAAAVAPAALAQRADDFDFLFFTDTHLQPEMDAAKGCDMAFKKMRGDNVAFAIQGGDHIFDALGVPTTRSLSLFDMYDKTEQDLGLKVYHTVGNHDVFGIYTESGMKPTDPLYGKKYFRDHIGKPYYSFDAKGVHFIVLDSIFITADRHYEGRIDDAQLKWLAADLAAQAATQPIVLVSHIPLVTAYELYNDDVVASNPRPHQLAVANTNKIFPLFHGKNVLGVLQGHTHVNELVEWQGVPYMTSGAVSGNWWKGTHLGTPEGYTVVSIRGGKLTTRYETYGFKSVDPHNT